MPGLTDVDVCNRALVRLGSKPISSFEASEGDKATACATIYPGLKTALIAMRHWRFSMNKKQLSRLVATPAGRYAYGYTLPTDMIAGPFAVFNTNAIASDPITNYEIFGDKLFTDETEIWIDYQVDVVENKLPPWFAELLVLATCAGIGMLVTESAKLVLEYQERAFGTPSDNMRGGMFAVCTNIDNASSPAIQVQDNTLVEARQSL